ncbi:ABC transporter ATP-binding protein [Rariglobus hedericola]|uniref:ABC transporter ATP-binding protein n=1 Tax=Rariglobus hedericola TaxID=2597822 RepID=A0A556QJ68_9BACT|nr:ATP-binding cassette domain-containing protein [Rariglobus hedericola]TSJ76667.1 ABC transporter ATP-binding protein [Rariglobus hedericola]
MSDSIIQLENVGVYYRGGRQRGAKASSAPWALRGLTLDIRRGEKLGVVGRNGCGKSTLLRLLANIISPDEGSIRYDRPDLHVQLLALGVGFEGHLSGAENAILSGLFMGKSKRHMESRLREIQEFSGLGDAFHKQVNTYSSGMNARLGFSIGLQTDPDIFLIDEVLGVGDKAFLEKSKAALRERFQANTTVVLISHDARTISEVCDRAVWMNAGRILAEGDPTHVCETYETGIASSRRAL